MTAQGAPSTFRGEAEATLAFAIASGVGALVGLIVFWGRPSPLWSGWSVGAVAAIAAGALALIAAYVANWRSRHAPTQQWRLSIPSWKFILDATVVAVVHAALVMIVTVALFVVLQRAFTGLLADAFLAAVSIGLAAGLSAYWTSISCQTITTQRMSTLLVAYMLMSVFASMLTVSDPLWWEYHFSQLGSFGDGSASLFNITLIVAGGMVVAFSVYIGRDLQLAVDQGLLTRKKTPRTVATLFVIMGIMLAGVGAVPVPVSEPLHVAFASGMFAVFIGMLIAARRLFDGLPYTVHIITWIFLAAIALTVVLFWPIGYFNLTALELVAFGLIFGWIVVFIRLESAARESATVAPATND